MVAQHKVAVLGTGSIGSRHIQVLQELQAEFVAIPTRSGRQLELESKGWTCASTLREAKELGATCAIVATDTARHVPDAEEALGLGLPVLLEKPMATSAKAAVHLPQLASKHGLGLFVGCPLRFDPGLRVVRERLTELGAIHSVRIECRSYLPDWRPNRDYRNAYSSRADEGGVLRDLIHEIDYALWLFDVPRQVCGELRNLGRLGIQSEELAEGHWITPSGTFVTIGLDYLSRHPCRRLYAYGSEGTLEYDFIARKLRLQRKEVPAEEFDFPRIDNDIYLLQINEFLSILSGGPPLLIASAQDGLNALSLCDAWRQSATTHCVETINL